MKYLKIYEEYYSDIYRVDTSKLKYNIDDYVLLDVVKIMKNVKDYNNLDDMDDLPSDKAKIIEIISNDEFPYRITFDNTNKTTSVAEDEIIRNLSPIEIDNFDANKEGEKYNL